VVFSARGVAMRMNVNCVRYFLAVCEERSFSEAARTIGISQPTLSVAIQRLEDELGGRLFERSSSSGTVRLTDLGRSLRPHFRKLDRCVGRMELVARAAIADRHQTTISLLRQKSSKRIGYHPV